MSEERLNLIKENVYARCGIGNIAGIGMSAPDKEEIELIDYVEELKDQLQQIEKIIKEAREKLNTQLAFTSSYQLNYQSAMSIIEEAKSILDKEK